MKPRLLFWSLGLVIALLAIACAPTAPTESPSTVSEPATEVPVAATEAAPAAAQTEAPAAVVPAVVVTPRGDALEATDPATVSLASGGLQLVEFFRFT
jgi:hypothetical protein